MLKITNRIISMLITVVMLIGCLCIVVSSAADDGYSITFNYNVVDDYGEAKIYVKGGVYLVGRYGLKYNTNALKLVKKSGDNIVDFTTSDTLADVVEGYSENKIIITSETNTTDEMIDTEKGRIYFAWHSSTQGTDVHKLDATTEKKQVATIYFTLAEGFSADDLKKATDLFSVTGNTNLPDGWNKAYEVAEDDNGVQRKEISSVINGKADGISIDISDLTGVTYETGRTVIRVTLPGTLNSNEGFYSSIDKYKISIYYDDEIASTTVEKSEIDAQNGLTLPDFNSENGIASGTVYTVYVTPITSNDNTGVSCVINSVATEGIGQNNGGSVPPTSGGGGGGAGVAPAQFTVQFKAGEGSFPENEKHTFSVAPNALISAYPEVIEPVGKIFSGWSLDGEHIVDLSNYKITANTILTALFEIGGVHETFIGGYPDGTVGPERGLTRAEAAAIIARASEDFDANKTYTSNFADVDSNEWYANYISFVFEKGIVTGYADNTFLPSNLITRAEFATIMQRFGSLKLNENVIFSDVDANHWAKAYVGACKDAGLINGYEDGTFRPSNNITRAEAVTILNRISGRNANSTAIDNYINDNGIPFSDLEKSKWYFYEVMEAAFRHMIYYFHN